MDAFFLGKALAEALNERIESAVGEFFSTIGRLQSEQQKQVQEFQVKSLLSCFLQFHYRFMSFSCNTYRIRKLEYSETFSSKFIFLLNIEKKTKERKA